MAQGNGEPWDVGNPKVLVTLPVHNEFPRLRASIRALKSSLDASGMNYTLSICEDGSDDGTKELLQVIRKEDPAIIIYTFPQKMGRGWALRNHWKDLPYDIFAFCDADLATGPDSVISAIRHVREGYGLVIGSRYVDGSIVKRPPARKLVSKLYNRLLRLIFNDGIYDHQCGLKALSIQALQKILPASVEDSWFWDTEVILIANELGIKTLEMPVSWVEIKVKRTHLLRLVQDVFLHGTGILRLKGELYHRTERFVAPGFLDGSLRELGKLKAQIEDRSRDSPVNP